MTRTINFLFLVFIVTTLVAGCGTVGAPFDQKLVSKITSGTTTREQVRELFGQPFRVGIENGKKVWIYEYSRYSITGKSSSKDVIIVFDDKGIVHSHQIMSSGY